MLTNKYIYLSSLCLMVFGFTSQNLLSQSSDSRLEEVVVTAQKKEQGSIRSSNFYSGSFG